MNILMEIHDCFHHKKNWFPVKNTAKYRGCIFSCQRSFSRMNILITIIQIRLLLRYVFINFAFDFYRKHIMIKIHPHQPDSNLSVKLGF